MPAPILATKLYRPRPRPQIVPRPRLVEKLNEGLHHKLTLISAPAGFGKTTAVSEWINNLQETRVNDSSPTVNQQPEIGDRVAWLSLDERDADPTRFLTYFIAALQTLPLSFSKEPAAAIGESALSLLQSPQPPPAESILTILLNEIAVVPQEFALVLDDYHVVDAPPIDQILTFLLDHMPPQMHLLITTREDPPLPLSRLRVRGQLSELRASDLRFTAAETAVFLNQVTGLDLSAAEITALDRRTEGWVAGLQLAALSMQGRADVHGFVASFAGDDRYIVDYLVDEVLQRQPEHIRRFLLQTSILNRLSGPLCEAVCFHGTETPLDRVDYSLLLETLERSNLFVIPLDDKRIWYRYHHLFAGVLQAHLIKEQPEALPGLHQRASAWHEQNDLTADAVHHAFAAADFERAARIIELAWAEMDRSRQSAIWLAWAQKLPDELLHTRPVLSAGYAWALLDSGELEAAEMRLRDAEQCLATTAGYVIADQEELQYLPASIASARTYLALALDDMPATVQYARQALDLLPDGDYLRRGTPAALLGLAFWAQGDLAEAQQAFTDAMTSYQKAGNILFVITGAYVLADMKLAHGHLREAEKTYQQALQLAQEHGDLVMRGAPDLHTGLSELYLEQNDLPAAVEHLLRSKKLGQDIALPRWHFRWCLAQARIKEAQGELDEALASLDEAQRHYVRGPVPDIRSIPAMKSRIWVAQGRLKEAQRWADAQGLSIDDNLTYLREFDHLTLTRILIAHYRRDKAEHTIQDAVSLLQRLLQAAEAEERMGSVLEILILQALAHAARGDMPAALPPLEKALVLAEPEGYIRRFIGQGSEIAPLLSAVAARGMTPDYSTKLLAALSAEKQRATAESQSSPPLSAASQPLVEPLSDRELEVLRLVAQGLSNRQIASQLYLALSTVKGHNRNIYSKLQVSRRTEAVARARELGLV